MLKSPLFWKMTTLFGAVLLLPQPKRDLPPATKKRKEDKKVCFSSRPLNDIQLIAGLITAADSLVAVDNWRHSEHFPLLPISPALFPLKAFR